MRGLQIRNCFEPNATVSDKQPHCDALQTRIPADRKAWQAAKQVKGKVIAFGARIARE